MTTENHAGPTTRTLRSRGSWAWLVAYVLILVTVVVAMFQARQAALTTMGTDQAQADWEAWRKSEPNQSNDLPVRRRPPKSTEPPALVLMRDHFQMLLGAAILFSSLLFGALMIAARGAFAKQQSYPPQGAEKRP